MTRSPSRYGVAVTLVSSCLFAGCWSGGMHSGPTPSGLATQPSRHGALPALPFNPGSFWYRPLPGDTPVNPKSGEYVAALQGLIAQYYGRATIDTTNFSTPVYTVQRSQPTVAIRLWECRPTPHFANGKYVNSVRRQLAHVPLPANAEPAAGTDAALVVWQPSTDNYWETWKTRRVNGQWQACWGGHLAHASHTNGTFPNPYGSTATGISLLGGLMRISELEHGQVDHVIDVALPQTRQGVLSWPATHDDGLTDSSAAIPEGLRFRLDPALDLSKLHLSPLALTVAKALQRYGMVVRDKAGGVAFYGEDATPMIRSGQPNPYVAIFAGIPRYKQFDNFPWQHLIALPRNYGAP